MTIKTLGRITWDEIKIGEVYAQNGCCQIKMKVSKTKCILLADDWRKDFNSLFFPGECFTQQDFAEFYKLSEVDQRLWANI